MNEIILHNALDPFPLDDQSINCCVTSPPYWGLRDYGVEGQIGLEKTPEEFIDKLVQVFREVKRVLKDDGTLWVNIGDSYASAKSNRTDRQINGRNSTITGKNNQLASAKQPNKIVGNLKPKDLVGIPWMLAFALRNDGWYLRQDIIWSKPNPMPESVKDRCTKAHEYIFLLSKSKKYYYDQYSIAKPYAEKTKTTWGCETKAYGDGTGLIASENIAKTVKVHKPKVWKTPDGWDTTKGSHGTIHKNGREKGKKNFKHPNRERLKPEYEGRANKRSVWNVATKGFKEAHFATFPPELILDCIKAGCPEGGIVLDPFGGSGTTGIVAGKLGRNSIMFDLNQKYIEEIAKPRISKELGMFA